MPEERTAGWGGRVAVAIVRGEEPQVFVASDAEVLGRLLALKLVAPTPPERLSESGLATIRQALLREDWGDAVAAWIADTGEIVDAYPDDELWSQDRLDADAAAFEIRMSPIFEGTEPEASAP